MMAAAGVNQLEWNIAKRTTYEQPDINQQEIILPGDQVTILVADVKSCSKTWFYF